jgi:hypothetical protein
VCLCYKCNKLQGTDSWATFLKKYGVEDPKAKAKESIKQSLNNLKIKQLKLLASKHHVMVKGQVEESLFDSHRLPPTKQQYINKLSGVVTEKEINSIPKEAPVKVKRKKPRDSNSFW